MKLRDVLLMARTACSKCRSISSFLLEIDRELKNGNYDKAIAIRDRLYASRHVPESDKMLVEGMFWLYNI